MSEGAGGAAARTVVQVTPVGDAPIVKLDAEMTVAAGATVTLHIEVTDADERRVHHLRLHPPIDLDPEAPSEQREAF